MTGNRTPNQIIGAAGEDLATAYFKKHQYKILKRNYHCKFGEVDLIVMKDDVIHFVEVKNRSKSFIPGRYAVTNAKQKHIRAVVNHYLQEQHAIYDYTISFDVVEITAGELEFFENCFY